MSLKACLMVFFMFSDLCILVLALRVCNLARRSLIVCDQIEPRKFRIFSDEDHCWQVPCALISYF